MYSKDSKIYNTKWFLKYICGNPTEQFSTGFSSPKSQKQSINVIKIYKIMTSENSLNSYIAELNAVPLSLKEANV